MRTIDEPSTWAIEFEAAANKPVGAKLGFCFSTSSASTSAPESSLDWNEAACDGSGPLFFRLTCASDGSSLLSLASCSLVLLRAGDRSRVLLCFESGSPCRLREDSWSGLRDLRRFLSLSSYLSRLSLLFPPRPESLSAISLSFRRLRRRLSSSESDDVDRAFRWRSSFSRSEDLEVDSIIASYCRSSYEDVMPVVVGCIVQEKAVKIGRS